MAVDARLLQGQIVSEDESEKKDVERLLAEFLKALLAEQNIPALTEESA